MNTLAVENTNHDWIEADLRTMISEHNQAVRELESRFDQNKREESIPVSEFALTIDPEALTHHRDQRVILRLRFAQGFVNACGKAIGLIDQVLPNAVIETERLESLLEKAMNASMKRLAKMGITPEADPLYAANPRAAEQKIRVMAQQTDDWKDRKNAIDEHKALMGYYRSLRQYARETMDANKRAAELLTGRILGVGV